MRSWYPRSSVLAPLVVLIAIGIGSDAAEPAHNVELIQIHEADQKDREAPVSAVDWKAVGPRDAARRKRVRELLEQGGVRTGKDFERAAMIFQHGETSEDILFAHVLAVTSLGNGNAGARWLAAASLDRYLHRLEQPQIFGTQFTNKEVSKAGRLDDGAVQPEAACSEPSRCQLCARPGTPVRDARGDTPEQETACAEARAMRRAFQQLMARAAGRPRR